MEVSFSSIGFLPTRNGLSQNQSKKFYEIASLIAVSYAESMALLRNPGVRPRQTAELTRAIQIVSIQPVTEIWNETNS